MLSLFSGDGPFRLLNGGIPGGEGTPGRLYIYSVSKNELTLVEIGGDGQAGSTYALTVLQGDGLYENTMAMENTETGDILWFYPSSRNRLTYMKDLMERN